MGSIGHDAFDVASGTWTASETLCRVLGVEPSPRHTTEERLAAVHPDDREALRAYLERDVLAAREPFHREYRVVRPSDGRERWVRGFGELTLDEEGRPVTMIGTIQDVTDRARAEIARDDAEERFRRVIANLPDILYRVRPGPSLTFEYVSPAAEAVTGYTVQEHYRDPDLGVRIVHPEDRERWLEIVHGQRRPANPFLLRFVRKDGETIWVEHRWAPVHDRDGRVVAIDGVARDVTDRVRAEAERDELAARLAQAQKLESIGRLAGGVAHDFNNMLSVIVGQTELGLDERDDGARRRSLESVLGAARRSADLTRQLLAFAREQAIRPRPVDLDEQLDRMLSLLRRLIGENVSLEWASSPVPSRVFIDPTQIDQVVANLVVNARDAIESAGSIRLSTREVELDEAFCATHPGMLPGRFVELLVADDGSGMDEDTLHQIFEPFFTTKEVGEGSGLGLATVYGVMQQNGGAIVVHSTVGVGTEFRLYFPVLEVVGEVLRRHGYTPLPAHGPSEALRVAGAHAGRIDLLLTDVVMPEMSGPELVERLAGLHGEVPVVYMSGYARHAHAGGPRAPLHHLEKPFSRADLLACVHEALHGPPGADADRWRA